MQCKMLPKENAGGYHCSIPNIYISGNPLEHSGRRRMVNNCFGGMACCGKNFTNCHTLLKE